MEDRKPEIIVFAGPNGSGKSTLTALLRPPYAYINADEIKLTNNCTDLEASQVADGMRVKHLEKLQDFSFETVLSTDRNLNLLIKAKDAGYFIKCYYILTTDPSINVARVRFRALSGGHGVPVDKIISRYHKALALIPELVQVCDIMHIYDNSDHPYRIFRKRKDIYSYNEYEELWSADDIVKLTGITDATATDLNQ